jgi:hypothetical protein
MDKWGDQVPTEMWKEEHEAEVAAFYRCTCDYRALNLKSKSDVFPLPRINDLLDQIPRGSKHFSSGDVQDAFWTVKLAEWCRERTGIIPWPCGGGLRSVPKPEEDQGHHGKGLPEEGCH